MTLVALIMILAASSITFTETLKCSCNCSLTDVLQTATVRYNLCGFLSAWLYNELCHKYKISHNCCFFSLSVTTFLWICLVHGYVQKTEANKFSKQQIHYSTYLDSENKANWILYKDAKFFGKSQNQLPPDQLNVTYRLINKYTAWMQISKWT